MFMIPCERLQAVELVSPSAVEAVVVDDMNSVTTNDCRQLEVSCFCRAGVLRFRSSYVLGPLSRQLQVAIHLNCHIF